MVTHEELMDSLQSLGSSIDKFKFQRDELLKAAKKALVELERYKEGTDERYALRNAIALAEGGK